MRQSNMSLGHKLHLRSCSLVSGSTRLTIVQSPLSNPGLDSRVNGLGGWDVETPQEETSPEDLDCLCTHLQLTNIYGSFIIFDFSLVNSNFLLHCSLPEFTLSTHLSVYASIHSSINPPTHPSSNHLLSTPEHVPGAEDGEMTYVCPWLLLLTD